MMRILLCLVSAMMLSALDAQVLVKGTVRDERSAPVQGVIVQIAGSNGIAQTDSMGQFELSTEKRALLRLKLSHIGYHTHYKDVSGNADPVILQLMMKQKLNLLDSVTVTAVHKPETLVGKPDYSIYDFDFHEDKLILLTSEKGLNRASLRYSDYSGKVTAHAALPRSAGTAKLFFHDYEGYTNLICSDTIFRLDIMNGQFLLASVSREEFRNYTERISDTANGHLYYSDRWEKYPLFSYYYFRKKDSVNQLLTSIANAELLQIYNMEYYFLPPRAQLEARRIAAACKTDKRIIAAMMSGFTQSMYYEPLYAPLFVFNDTVCVFNHYSDHIYRFNRNNCLIDSVKISYHHPKNWREWKKQMYADEFENKVYALFSRNGRQYLKQIDHRTGKEVLTYRLKQPGADRIKIKDGHVYYVYRPFESTQERFLYREKIE
jgi:hypothetical protein